MRAGSVARATIPLTMTARDQAKGPSLLGNRRAQARVARAFAALALGAALADCTPSTPTDRATSSDAAVTPSAQAAATTSSAQVIAADAPVPLGVWTPFAKAIPGAKEAATTDPAKRTRFIALDRGGWRCTGDRCEVLDGAGRAGRVHTFPCSVGLGVYLSAQRRFGAVSCPGELTVFSLVDDTRWSVKPGEVDIRTIKVDDDGTLVLSVLPHGSLLRIERSGKVERLQVTSPTNAHDPGVTTFIGAAHDPWLAYSAGGAGGELVWSRAAPTQPLQIAESVFFNGPRCWSVGTSGEAWRVEPSGKTKLPGTVQLRRDGGLNQSDSWGRDGLVWRYGIQQLELRGPDLELRERFEASFNGVVESNPRGDRIYVVDPEDGRIDVRGVAGPETQR
jgi:hypothetical protein